MSEARWEMIEKLTRLALAVPAERRSEFLATACGHDQFLMEQTSLCLAVAEVESV